MSFREGGGGGLVQHPSTHAFDISKLFDVFIMIGNFDHLKISALFPLQNPHIFRDKTIDDMLMF